ncbi:MAG: hypothetical protein KGQ93_10715 [Cyanobacteria bacterium REEB459]|nr:hypothetical protein [Cyanobacteria bacterium REEB459]
MPDRFHASWSLALVRVTTTAITAIQTGGYRPLPLPGGSYLPLPLGARMLEAYSGSAYEAELRSQV